MSNNIMVTETWAEGNTLPSFRRAVNQRRVDAYADASGDHNPIHLDAEYAATTRFGQRVAHGMLSLAFVWEMVGYATDGNFNGVTVKVRFTSPVIPGETVTVSGTVKSVDNDKVTCDIHVTRPNGELALTGTATWPASDAPGQA